MASVVTRGAKFYLKWKDAAGKWQFKVSQAKTKTEAKRLAAELERRAERQRLGLEVLPTDFSMTLWELCDWWLENRCTKPTLYRNRNLLEYHVHKNPIGGLPLAQVTASRVEQRMAEMERDGTGPQTVNKLRVILHTVFARGRKAQLWAGPNPIADVEARKVPRRAYETLRDDEVPLLLAHADPDWRNFFAAACYAALRKGELCGLLKTDVDLQSRVITVARSYNHDTTKGGHADAIPIAEPLVPYLQDAIARSPSAWVFPAADGSMRTDNCSPGRALRKALARAGLGRDKIRFHDLRHTTATLLLRAKVDPHRVQKILRHADVRTTINVYTHLDVEDLRDAVNRIAPRVPAVERTAPDGASVVQDEATGKALPGFPENSSIVPAAYVTAQAGFAVSPVSLPMSRQGL